MILAELNKLLVNVARSNYLVNDAFVGDVYTINSKENRYGCFVATPMSAVKNSGVIRFTYVLYYIDRLTKDEVNIDYVQSDAVSVLKGVIEYIGENGVEIEPGYEFILFRQKFSDWCAGAYVNVHIVVPDNDCNDGDFNISGYDLIPLVVSKNGIYTPGSGVDGYSRVTINVPQTGATESWVDDEITSRLSGYATESWVSYYVDNNDQNPCVRADAFSGLLSIGLTDYDYASRSWVSTNFLSSRALEGYVTQNWVVNQGYISSIPSGYATKSWISNQGFVTQSDISGYATKSWVSDQGYATQSWVESQSYLSSIPDYFATQSWVEEQGYLTSFSMEDYVLKSNSGMYIDPSYRRIRIISSNSYYYRSTLLYDNMIVVGSSPLNNPNSGVETKMTATIVGAFHTSKINNIIQTIRYAELNVTPGLDPRMIIQDYSDKLEIGISSIYTNINGVSSTININDIATRGWISNQGYATLSDISGLASETWVRNQHYVSSTDLSVYATKSWVVTQGYITTSDLCGYATESWVSAQNYLISDDLCGYATESWTKNWVTAQSYLKQCDLDGYATENWVERQGYLSSVNMSNYATVSWVETNFLSSTALSGYATQSWVINQSYATQSWVINQSYATTTDMAGKLDVSLIWRGHIDEWDDLPPEEKCTYLIAMIVGD